MALNVTDIVIIISYFVLIVLTGMYLSRRWAIKSDNGYDGYLLAGRKVTLPLFVATLVATWYGNILGVGEFVYKNGLVAWMCFMFPYYIAAGLYSIFISKKIRMSNARTIPEQFTQRYDATAGWIASLFILVITIPAAYFLMLGIIIQMFSGWELWICIVIGAIFSLSYIYNGGLKADILTNAVQFILMYVGFGVLLYFSMEFYGYPFSILDKLPNSHKTLFGDSSWQYILAWLIIALQTFVDPSFYQRASAARTPQVAQKGVLLSIGCWVVFDTFTLLTGFYARAFFDLSNPLMAYPVLGDLVLPHLWKGIFVVSLLATIMSSLDSYAFISAATIGNDILSKLRKFPVYTGMIERREHRTNDFDKGKRYGIRRVLAAGLEGTREMIVEYSHRNKDSRALIKIGLVLTGILGIIMALSIGSVIELIYKTSSIAVPALLVPLIVSYSNKYYMSTHNVKLIMLVAGGISLIFTIFDIYLEKSGNLFGYKFLYIEPMTAGIVVSSILGIIFIKRVKQN